jgi:hypothetical protein
MRNLFNSTTTIISCRGTFGSPTRNGGSGWGDKAGWIRTSEGILEGVVGSISAQSTTKVGPCAAWGVTRV